MFMESIWLHPCSQAYDNVYISKGQRPYEPAAASCASNGLECEDWAYEKSALDMAAESQRSGGAVVLRTARKDG